MVFPRHHIYSCNLWLAPVLLQTLASCLQLLLLCLSQLMLQVVRLLQRLLQESSWNFSLTSEDPKLLPYLQLQHWLQHLNSREIQHLSLHNHLLLLNHLNGCTTSEPNALRRGQHFIPKAGA